FGVVVGVYLPPIQQKVERGAENNIPRPKQRTQLLPPSLATLVEGLLLFLQAAFLRLQRVSFALQIRREFASEPYSVHRIDDCCRARTSIFCLDVELSPVPRKPPLSPRPQPVGKLKQPAAGEELTWVCQIDGHADHEAPPSAFWDARM